MEVKNLKKTRTIRVGDVAGRAAAAAHEGIEELQKRATKAERHLVERAEARGQSIVKRAGGVVLRVTNYIEEHPFTSVTLAFGVGILATMMLRKSGVDLAQLLTPPPEDDLTD
jgi:ElaB/YqjD/DUF883 family membrane-anchored ribosome-binding protein